MKRAIARQRFGRLRSRISQRGQGPRPTQHDDAAAIPSVATDRATPLVPGVRVFLGGGKAAELADLQALYEDLDEVIACLVTMQSLDQTAAAKSVGASEPIGALNVHPVDIRSPDFAQVANRALWHAAIMAYGRCFRGRRSYTKGAAAPRIRPEHVEALSAQSREAHESALEQRDRWVGHRVTNLFHQVYLTLPNASASDVQSHTAIGVWRYEAIPSSAEASKLDAAATELRTLLSEDLRHARAEISDAARKGEADLRRIVQDVALDGRSITTTGTQAEPS